MKLLVALTLLLCLSACNDGPKLMTHDEVEDIASDVAADAVDDSEKIQELEGRVEALEAKLNVTG